MSARTKSDTTGTKTGARATGDAAEEGFTAEERAAMKERAKEVRSARTKKAKADPEAEVLAKIADMPDDDRAMAERIHAIVRQDAPSLTPRLWYGMPAYARDGKVVCFFQSAAKMKSRYCTVGFGDAAALDEGSLWATSFAVTAWNAANEKSLRALVRQAFGV